MINAVFGALVKFSNTYNKPKYSGDSFLRVMQTEYRKDYEMIKKNYGPVTEHDAKMFLKNVRG